MNSPTIGPTLISTIVSCRYRESVTAWCDYLYQHIHSESAVSKTEAEAWGFKGLAGAKITWLANELDEPWLRIIESPGAQQTEPFTHYGWLSLEINVADVDQLYTELVDSPFKIIGEPANLDVSDDIRAMQVVGLDGEVLYLTEVKAPVPPFELPTTRCAVDRLFIPVAIVPDRGQALAVYENFEHTSGIQFDTKITVINSALGFDVGRRHPVATVQLAGRNLVELDQVDGLNRPTLNQSLPINGIGMISFSVQELPKHTRAYTIDQGPYQGKNASTINGAAGELMELIAD